MLLKNRKVLVTGVSRGIGLAIAKLLAAEGAYVIGTSANGIQESSITNEMHTVDFSESHQLQDFCEAIKSTQIDIVINNAGINKISDFAEISLADYQRIIAVNLTAPLMICRAVIPHMKAQSWGRIVNISSIFGKISKEYRALYSASKFGLDGMTIALAAELSQHNILANCVAPGFTDTELTRRILSEADIQNLIAKVPARRLAQPQEIAELVLWLASSKNSYVTGQNIAIDGGFTRV